MHELGGCLSFCKRPYHGLQNVRCGQLAAKWVRLGRSMAPFHAKLRSLISAFWPAALHGANGSVIGEALLTDLRKEAMKALKIKKAGTNPWLRLTLSSTPLADPEFWLIQTTVLGFRRLLRKEPILYQHWISFHRSYIGTLYSGPFSQLLVLLNRIGWHVQPPYVLDHDGCWHDLLLLPCCVLKTLLLDGWMQFVAGQVTSRLTMGDLKGLDTHLTLKLGDSVRCSPNCFVGSYPVWYVLCFSSSCKVRHVQGWPLPTLGVDLSEIFTSSYSYWCLGSCRV